VGGKTTKAAVLPKSSAEKRLIKGGNPYFTRLNLQGYKSISLVKPMPRTSKAGSSTSPNKHKSKFISVRERTLDSNKGELSSEAKARDNSFYDSSSIDGSLWQREERPPEQRSFRIRKISRSASRASSALSEREGEEEEKSIEYYKRKARKYKKERD